VTSIHDLLQIACSPDFAHAKLLACVIQQSKPLMCSDTGLFVRMCHTAHVSCHISFEHCAKQLYLQSLPVLADIRIMLYICNEGLADDDVIRAGVVVQLLVPLLHHPPLQTSCYSYYKFVYQTCLNICKEALVACHCKQSLQRYPCFALRAQPSP